MTDIRSVPSNCFQCEVVFPNEQAFQNHKASDHTDFTLAKPLRAGVTPRITLEQAVKLEEVASTDITEIINGDLPPGVPSEALPDQAFLDTIARIEGVDPAPDPTAIEAHKREMEAMLAAAPKQEPTKPKEVRKIELTYVYTGDCPTCKNPVITLESDIDLGKAGGKKHFVSAFCINCKKQIFSREEKDLK